MNKPIILLSLICTAALSCNTITIKTYEEAFQFPLAEAGDTLGTYVAFNLEYCGSFKGDKALTEKMNKTIRDSVFFGEWAGILPQERKYLPSTYRDGDFHSCAKIAALILHLNEVWNEGLFGAENYYMHQGRYFWEEEDDDDNDDDKGVMTWYAITEGSFLSKYKNFQNYWIENDIYSGGAHGNTFYTPIVFNMDNAEVVRITDIIPEENNGLLLKIANEKGHYQGHGILYQGDTMPERFTMDETGITWYTQPYEWGPDVMDFTLSWEDLAPVLCSSFTKRRLII